MFSVLDSTYAERFHDFYFDHVGGLFLLEMVSLMEQPCHVSLGIGLDLLFSVGCSTSVFLNKPNITI